MQRLAGGRGGFLGQAGGEQCLGGFKFAGGVGAMGGGALLFVGREQRGGFWRGIQPARCGGGHRHQSAGGQGLQRRLCGAIKHEQTRGIGRGVLPGVGMQGLEPRAPELGFAFEHGHEHGRAVGRSRVAFFAGHEAFPRRGCDGTGEIGGGIDGRGGSIQ